MSDICVAVIIGSLRSASINRKLAQEVIKLNAPGLSFDIIEIGDLPLYNQDFEGGPAPGGYRLPRQGEGRPGRSGHLAGI